MTPNNHAVQRHRKRLAGILIPAFSTRHPYDFGIGDTHALRHWIDWAVRYNVGFIQLLPINENGIDESPYSAISSAALDPIYLTLDPTEIPWLDASDFSKARARLGTAHASDQVDYPKVRKIKRTIVELAWARFDEAPKELLDEFKSFKKKEASWLNDYCLFRFLMEHHGEHLTWDQWPNTCNTPELARNYFNQIKAADPQSADYRLSYFAFAQWLCFRQWRGLRAYADAAWVKLMGDVPIGIAWHSSDVFFKREEFHLEWFGGSPPEGHDPNNPFFAQWGQNWGIPLYRWNHMQADGFSWWNQRIQRLTEVFHIFRLDHILGFYRIYAFPWHPNRNHEFIGLSNEQAIEMTHDRLPRWFSRPDDTPENQDANRADGDPRLRAIIHAANGADIIAEDLGWVPHYVRPHLADLKIACFKIPHWDCDSSGHPQAGDSFPENSFATYSTHDHDPIQMIWNGCRDFIIEYQKSPQRFADWQVQGAHHTLRVLSEFAGIPLTHESPWPPYTEGVRLRLMKALFASNSHFAVYMITELFGINTRINRPGTSAPNNWSFRMPWSVDEIEADSRLQDICRKLATTIQLTHRAE